MFNYIRFILLIIISTSCSLFIKLDKLQNNDIKLKEVIEKETTCKITNSNQTIYSGTNKKAIWVFQKAVRKISEELELSFIDKSILWSLYQMNIRPDLSTPGSRLQLIITIDNQLQYWDFFKRKENLQSYPFLFGLNYLLKHYQSRNNLQVLANGLDKYLPRYHKISYSLASGLKKYKSIIASSKSLRIHYLKSNQIIKQNESLIKLPYSKMINEYGKFDENNYHISNHLFTYNTPKSKLLPFTSIRCNQDLNLYDHGIYLTTKTPNEGNVFTIVSNDNSFIAVTNLGTQDLSGLDNSLLFNNVHRGNTFTLCSITNSLQKSKLILVSGKGRDPGQHLYHLIKEKIPLSTSIADLEDKVKQSRHLFLPSPPRIVFEADKDQDFKLQKKLRKYNVPIYHSDNMGHIVMISNFATSEIGVFPDTNRNKSEICSK